MSIPLVITLLVCLTFFLLFLGISSYLKYSKEREEWIERAKGTRGETSPEQISASGSTTKEYLLKFLSILGKTTTLQNAEELSLLRRPLLQAGYRRADAPIIFFGARLCCALFLPVVFALLRTPAIKTLSTAQMMFFSVLFAVIGFYLPNLWVWIKTRRRKRKILDGLPEALDLMVVCVEAGLGLDAAISRAGEEMRLSNTLLSEEFRLVNLELRAGQSRQNALRNLSLRTGLEDVGSLISMLIQTDRFGTSVAQALRIHADSMRTRRMQKAEELAAKLPVKLVFPLILFILPSLFVVILGPGIIRLVKTLLPALSSAGQ